MSHWGDLLGSDGPLESLLSRFRPRPGQVAMAEAVSEALEDQIDLVVEAATGTGKTLAYLLPILQQTDRAIISTGTLNLQDQLFKRDLPLALRTLGIEKDVALLKGRSNYLCLHRLEQHAQNDALKDGNVAEDLRHVKAWSGKTMTGDIAELGQVPQDSPIWPWVTSTQDNCLGSECPLFSKCHVVQARRLAQSAELVVVNHHLLFADLALKQSGFGEVLPGADVVVMDEAHQVPETAMRFFSQALSAWQIRELIRDALIACGQAPGTLALLKKPIEEVRRSLDHAVSAFHDLPSKGDVQKLEPIEPQLVDLYERLTQLSGALVDVAGQTKDLAQLSDRAQTFHHRLRAFLKGDEGLIRWFSNRQGRFNLNLTPADIAKPLAEIRTQVPATWIMTSATLTVADRFDHFAQQMGLSHCRELIVPTPFDYAKQTRLWIPMALPEPSDSGHTQALLEAIKPLLVASEGRAFLLFTSHRALKEAAIWLRAHSDFNLLVQEEAARGILLERFLTQPNSVLLGAQSFWEGVDVPGSALSVVVIDKLPFAPPDEPILEATIRAATERGERAFQTIQIPHAVLSLKQGAGRLIRQAEDFGVLVIGDRRIKTRGYGKIFQRSLPEMTEVEAIDEAVDFLYEQLNPVEPIYEEHSSH